MPYLYLNWLSSYNMQPMMKPIRELERRSVRTLT
jgi:hypothetical protein